MPPQTKYVDIYHVSDVYPIKMSHIALILSRSFQIFSRNVCFSSIKATSGCASQAYNFVLYCTQYLNGVERIQATKRAIDPSFRSEQAIRSRSEWAIDPSFNSSYRGQKMYLPCFGIVKDQGQDRDDLISLLKPIPLKISVSAQKSFVISFHMLINTPRQSVYLHTNKCLVSSFSFYDPIFQETILVYRLTCSVS